jgi:hypothetical protein
MIIKTRLNATREDKMKISELDGYRDSKSDKTHLSVGDRLINTADRYEYIIAATGPNHICLINLETGYRRSDPVFVDRFIQLKRGEVFALIRNVDLDDWELV